MAISNSMPMRAIVLAGSLFVALLTSSIAEARTDCGWAFPVGSSPGSAAPFGDFHPVGGNNLPSYGTHLGADYWYGAGGSCATLGEPVYSVADGMVVEIADNLGSYLDVVVVRHDDPELGRIYSMYGHLDREPSLREGQIVSKRTRIGRIGNVLAYFSPCHVHFELLNEMAYQRGPFCNGCQNAGIHVSPGYDQRRGISRGVEATGDRYIEPLGDGVTANRWYETDAFIQRRVGRVCAECGDSICDPGERQTCPSDCPPDQQPDAGTADGAGLPSGEDGGVWERGPGEYVSRDASSSADPFGASLDWGDDGTGNDFAGDAAGGCSVGSTAGGPGTWLLVAAFFGGVALGRRRSSHRRPRA